MKTQSQPSASLTHIKLKLSTLALGAALLLAGAGTGVSQTTNLINFDAGPGPVQSGAAIVGAAGDFWNSGATVYPATSFTLSSVNSSANTALSGVQISFNTSAGFMAPEDQNPGTLPMDAGTTNLMEDGELATTVINVSLSGLSAYNGYAFTLVIYGAVDSSVGVGNSAANLAMTAGAAFGNSGSTLSITAASRKISDGIGVAYNTFTGTINGSTLSFKLNGTATWTFLNGFQLQMVSPTVPTIATAPVSKTNVVGATVTFNVGATGATPLSYQWQATNSATGGFTNLPNAGVFSGVNSNVLTLTGITTSQGLAYQVIVTNIYGSVTSTPAATLTVLTIPNITGEPVSLTKFVGQAASFSVVASGVGTLGYQWQATNRATGGFTNLINGGQIFGANSSTLYVTSLTPNWALSYQVVVTNANGAVTSAPAATLTVLSLTNLINIDFDDLADGGATQTGAAAMGSPGDVWNSETPPGGFFVFSASGLTNSAGATTPFALTLFAAGGADTGHEFYPVTTADAATTSLMEDAAYSAGYFNLVMGGLSPGQQFKLTIYAAGTNGGGNVMSKYVGDDSTYTSATLQTNTAASQSIVAGPGVAYNTFTGIVGPGGAVIITVTPQADPHAHINGLQLQLIAPPDPAIATAPISQTSLFGATVTFNVSAFGTAPLSYQWQATNSATGGFTNLPNVGVFTGATSNVLTLTGITAAQALAYQVVVTNINGAITSTPAANLTVITIPVITNEPVSQSVLQGQTAVFSVGVAGEAPFSYQWQATNSTLGGFTNIVGATTNVLTLTGVTTNFASSYQVIVTNLNGSVTSAPPAILTILPATQLINGDIGLSGQPLQTDGAVLGTSGDVWNALFLTQNIIVNSASNTLNGVGYGILGGDSIAYNGGGSPMDAATSPLMSDFVYGHTGNLATFDITGLTPYLNSPFALVIYAAEDTVGEGATLTLTGATGGNATNTLATTGASRMISAGPGVAYQVFTGILTNGTLQVSAGVLPSEVNSAINGFQLLLSPTLPPLISTNPASVAVTSGSSATFSVGVLGTAPFGYQWQTNGVNIGNGGSISGATSNILNIASVSSKLVHLQVVVSNGSGSATSAPVNLNIIPGPSLLGEWLTNSIGGVPNLAELTGTQPQHGGYVVGAGSLVLQAGQVPPNYAGDSVYFDGNEAVAISNTVSTDAGYVGTYDSYLTNAMTVAFWAQYVPQPGAYVSKNGVTAGWQFQQTNGGAPYSPTFSVVGTGSGMTNLAAVAVTNTLNDGNWHHYAGTWDGPSGIRKVYVDGVLATNLSGDTGPANAASAFRLVLGGLDTVGNDAGILTPFVGALYDVRIYNYALNQAQVTGLYSNVTVVPGLSTNANLTSLTLSPAGTLNPAFASSTLSYSATNAFGSTPTVTVVDADLTATNRLIYNNATNLLASGTPSSALSLTLGTPNVVKVQVTAQDGVTVKTYTVNVIEQPSLSPRPKLTNSVSSGVLNLNWGGQYLGYRLLQQTNNLSKGVSTNLTDWGTVAGTASLTATNITILKTNLDEYYRLVYP